MLTMFLFYVLNMIVILLTDTDGYLMPETRERKCGFYIYNTTEIETPQAGKYVVMTPQVTPYHSVHIVTNTGLQQCRDHCLQSDLSNGQLCWAFDYEKPDICNMYYYDKAPTVVYRITANHTSTPKDVSVYLKVCASEGVNATLPPRVVPIPPRFSIAPNGTTSPSSLSTSLNGATTPSAPQSVSNISYIVQGEKSPTPGMCFHLNQLFTDGDHWLEGCRFDCECYNATTNTKLCTDVCPHHDEIPEGCVLTSSADGCCPYLDCIDTTPTYDNSTDTCSNKIDTCDFFDDDSCIGVYEPWARAHCALRCGYCNYTEPCIDRLSYCDIYEIDTVCTDFSGWARYNCRRSCSLCK